MDALRARAVGVVPAAAGREVLRPLPGSKGAERGEPAVTDLQLVHAVILAIGYAALVLVLCLAAALYLVSRAR